MILAMPLWIYNHHIDVWISAWLLLIGPLGISFTNTWLDWNTSSQKLARDAKRQKYAWSLPRHWLFSFWSHNDVIKWKHFPRYWPFVRGIHRSPVNSRTKPVTRSFDVFFDLHLNQQLSKHRRRWWFGTPSRSLWHHCNGRTLSKFQAWGIIIIST